VTSEARAAPDHGRFTAETGPLRRELLAHCYRMVGSAHDAEDLVQEVYLRAWRSYAEFEGRASIRSWLYTIATNVCLSALRPRQVRMLPSGLTGPYDGPDRAPAAAAPGEVSWLEPLPDAWIAPPADDPAAVAVERESLRLALIASLQHLPARQRAILILREVLAFSAAETAEILGTTTAAVKSGLQRARARLDEVEPHLHILGAYVLGGPGDWRMIATTANGQPAAVVYRRDPDGALRADGVVVLAATADGVARVVKFHDPSLVAAFGFPGVGQQPPPRPGG
jgi:RNA polymerase sigma-70 factor (ECF subfamily)